VSPLTIGALTLGSTQAANGIAALAATVCAGVLIACLSDSIFPVPDSESGANPGRSRLSGGAGRRVWAGAAGQAVSPARRHSAGPSRPAPSRAGRNRLAAGAAYLEYLDAERARADYPAFGRAEEDRIVWAELLELELQRIDEELNRYRRLFTPNS